MAPRVKTLPPRLAATPAARVATTTPGAWRQPDASSAARGYGYAWQKARAQHLRTNPLCVMCQELNGRVTVATVVDHVRPHRGDAALFWDRQNWQSLCTSCHSSRKQSREARGDA